MKDTEINKTAEEILSKNIKNTPTEMCIDSSTSNGIIKAMEEYAEIILKEYLFVSQSQPPVEHIKTINPVGYLKNGEYISFKEMHGATNDETDTIIPLYDIAAAPESPVDLAELPSDEKAKSDLMKIVIPPPDKEGNIIFWNGVNHALKYIREIASQLLAKKEDEWQIYHDKRVNELNHEIIRLNKELAQQQSQSQKEAIEFAEWIDRNDWERILTTKEIQDCLLWYKDGNERLETDELYQLFLQEKNKSQQKTGE